MPFAIDPPVQPMLARIAETLPAEGTFLYEPKWAGFRAIVFRGGAEVFIQSRDLKPLDRYFPELHALFAAALPDGCVVDGEIVIATPQGLDFDRLQMRLHPAASRVAKLARETPAAFVAFDVLAVEGRDVRAVPQAERRQLLDTDGVTFREPWLEVVPEYEPADVDLEGSCLRVGAPAELAAFARKLSWPLEGFH